MNPGLAGGPGVGSERSEETVKRILPSEARKNPRRRSLYPSTRKP
jgi:hypothetical protein